jgi:DNA-binding NtrC family response regulator
MKSPLVTARMSALAFLYDRMRDCPEWFRKLTPGQMEKISEVMVEWQVPSESNRIIPMEEIERRELLRAVMICQGNVISAAKALKIGKTTMYKKLRQWGYVVKNRVLMAQASALGKASASPRNDSTSSPHQHF